MAKALIGLRVATVAVPAVVLGYGIPYEVYRYSKNKNLELAKLVPELSDMDIEAYSPVVEEERPVKKTRRVWRQTGGRKFDSVFSVPKGVYTETYLQGLCKSKTYIPVIFRNWCAEAKFEQVDEEIN